LARHTATRELAGTSNVKTFWAVTDERGFVYRLIDYSGATWWQARWDASGWQTWVGTPQPEMWVPFGLPGQVVLGATRRTTGTVWGTEAANSGGPSATARPPIALNQWRGYDPFVGMFFQPDTVDQLGATRPEGYAYGFFNSVKNADPMGLATDIYECGLHEVATWLAAVGQVYSDISKCIEGECGLPGGDTLRRTWLSELLKIGAIACLNPDRISPFGSIRRSDGAIKVPSETVFSAYAYSLPASPELASSLIVVGYYHNDIHTCPKQIIAHEVLHIANKGLPWQVAVTSEERHFDWERTLGDYLKSAVHPEGWADPEGEEDAHERWVKRTVRLCVDC
jgi:hypothetical protein